MILYLYFARRFLWMLVTVTSAFLIVLVLIDMVEQSRKFARTEAGFSDIVELTLLNAPDSLYRILPLIVIFAAIALFLSLARTSELVATRAAGRSALWVLLSPVSVAIVAGLLAIAVLNPLVAATTKRYETLAARFTHGTASLLSVSSEGLWLRQGGDEGQTVIRAEGSNLDATKLVGVSFFSFDPEGRPARRIEAQSAELRDGAWLLKKAKLWPLKNTDNPERDAQIWPSFGVPSDLTPDRIRNSFGTPRSIPIWELPAFIARLDKAGFSARAHRVWLQMELAKPFLFVAMVLLGAAFTMRPARFGHTGVMVLMAVISGFALYFIRNFAQILGENGQIPVLIAAWAPPVAAISLALALILHLEDG